MKFSNRRIIYGCLCMIIMLSSCAVGKKYVQPKLGLPEEYRGKPTLTADTVKLPWKSFFKDGRLVTLIDRALQRNNDIAVALKNVEQATLYLKQSRHALMPMADLVAGANRSSPSQNSLNGSLTKQFTGASYLDDYSTTFRLSWEVDIWGKAKMQRDGAKADYFAQQEILSSLKTRVIVQVAQSYYNLVGLDEQLKIARKNIALSDSTLQMLRLQFNSGQVNSLAVEQAAAQKKTAELIVPLAQQNIAIQENALSILCGDYPDAIERSGDLLDLIPGQNLSMGVPAELLSRRPDLKAAEFAVISANAKTGLAKAAMYPSISLSPQIGVNSFKFNTWFDLPGSITKTLAANLAQPLLQKRSLRTAYQIAAVEQEKAVIQFRTTMMTAVSEVSDALAKSTGASERMLLVKEKTRSLDKATGDALKLYRSGMATYLEVITAQNNRLQNDLEAIAIKLEKLNAVSDLYRALGGGLE